MSDGDNLAWVVHVPIHEPKVQEYYGAPPIIGRSAIRVCWGFHEKAADCVWEDFVRSPALIEELIAERKERDARWLQRATSAEEKLSAARDVVRECLKQFDHGEDSYYVTPELLAQLSAVVESVVAQR